jgi:hypothetical protein
VEQVNGQTSSGTKAADLIVQGWFSRLRAERRETNLRRSVSNPASPFVYPHRLPSNVLEGRGWPRRGIPF